MSDEEILIGDPLTGACERLLRSADYKTLQEEGAAALNKKVQVVVDQAATMSEAQLRAELGFIRGFNRALDLAALLVQAHNDSQVQATEGLQADNPPMGLRPSPFEEGA